MALGKKWNEPGSLSVAETKVEGQSLSSTGHAH